ncbi:ATP-binding cassette domain-containing protein, partial [Escherichia coli]|uniref:ATP-binding cassette domain-containing protein n=1 Tax=Escherichia coli TaxID=562 RepID=UPI002284EFF7
MALDASPSATRVRLRGKLRTDGLGTLSGFAASALAAARPQNQDSPQDTTVISTANLTIQFGPKPLFENVSVKFGEGNRYGLIGANGSGKSTFMKIIGGD